MYKPSGSVENRERTKQSCDIPAAARLTNARLMLVHVADGWAAPIINRLNCQESEEMKHDREYLASLERELQNEV